jgi:hypothetical protein
MTQGRAVPGGILFPPTKSGKTYLSVYIHRGHHRGRKKVKAIWAITPDAEYDLFVQADDLDWYDFHGHYWAIALGGRIVLGTRGQRLAKFPCNSNDKTPWHGYPVSPSQDGAAGNCPPDAFIENWIQTEVVTRAFGRRLQRRLI